MTRGLGRVFREQKIEREELLPDSQKERGVTVKIFKGREPVEVSNSGPRYKGLPRETLKVDVRVSDEWK